MREKPHWKDIALLGVAIMGSVAGAGFASGQALQTIRVRGDYGKNDLCQVKGNWITFQ